MDRASFAPFVVTPARRRDASLLRLQDNRETTSVSRDEVSTTARPDAELLVFHAAFSRNDRGIQANTRLLPIHDTVTEGS